MSGLQGLQCKENLHFSATNQSGKQFCHGTYRWNFMQNSDFCRLHLNFHSGSFSPVQTSTLQFMHCSLEIKHPHCHATHFYHNKFHILSPICIYQPIGPIFLEGQLSSKVPRSQSHIKCVGTSERCLQKWWSSVCYYRKIPPFSWVAAGLGACCPANSQSQVHRDAGEHTLLAGSNRWSSRRRKTHRPRHPHIDAVARGAAVTAVVTIV